MKAQKSQNLLKQLVGCVGLTGATALLSFPALAQSNLHLHIFYGPLIHQAHGSQPTPDARHLFVQSTTGGG